jgi:hypothetical protein
MFYYGILVSLGVKIQLFFIFYFVTLSHILPTDFHYLMTLQWVWYLQYVSWQNHKCSRECWYVTCILYPGMKTWNLCVVYGSH